MKKIGIVIFMILLIGCGSGDNTNSDGNHTTNSTHNENNDSNRTQVVVSNNQENNNEVNNNNNQEPTDEEVIVSSNKKWYIKVDYSDGVGSGSVIFKNVTLDCSNPIYWDDIYQNHCFSIHDNGDMGVSVEFTGDLSHDEGLGIMDFYSTGISINAKTSYWGQVHLQAFTKEVWDKISAERHSIMGMCGAYWDNDYNQYINNANQFLFKSFPDNSTCWFKFTPCDSDLCN